MDLMLLVPTSKEQSNTNANKTFPVTEHKCKMPPEWDEIRNVIVGNGWFAEIRRWFRRKCLVSQMHPRTQFCLRSKAAISYEQTRHLNSYAYMIHPFSEFRIFWESLLILVVIASMIVLPFHVTFHGDIEIGEWFFFAVFLNSILLTDIVLWFMTGHHDFRTNVVVLEPRLVARKYIMGWFWFDVLPVLPMDLYLVLSGMDAQSQQLYRHFQMLKLLKLRTLIVYARRLRRVYHMSFQTHKSLAISISILLILHWAACAEYYISATVRRQYLKSGKDLDNWTTLPNVVQGNTFYKYNMALYRAVSAMVCALKSDEMISVEDVMYDVVLSICGRVGNIYVIAQWLQLTHARQGTNNNYSRLVPQLQTYMRQKELPPEIQHRLTTYYEYCTQRSIDLEKSIMRQLSPHLKEELTLHNSRKLVEKVTFFECLPEVVVSRIAMSLRTEVFLTNDIIFKAGTTGDAMYFIASGTVAIYTSLGKEVCHLKDGAHFGEISLVMENDQRLASVVAVEICELYVLSREDFQQVIEPFPSLMNILQKLVLERLEKTVFLGELYRLEGNIPAEVFNNDNQRSNSVQTSNNKT
ncbi:potassium/sodium hyperpolarization-activated cyclic nucleotide-gated channel 1-like [Diprion similis]|uniref:potassium/sodium hyperpolarization-activated cyclic nucleotide-gated channel 1-like n=1 Tax=Diprion similis TaxID=362088 RepID=UPI001EF7A195|nr:potassium/sodium hyperpolarization-activated cyclic nucleotide-gated channel 1-like [Diprion similis]